MPIKSDPAAWTDARHRLGLQGERIALAYLRRRGWRILEHRFRLGRLEIDVVARNGALVAFVEVKARRSAAFGSPLAAVPWAKQREIAKVAQAWIGRHGKAQDSYRFDVIGVTVSSDRPATVEHVPNAFQLGWRR